MLSCRDNYIGPGLARPYLASLHTHKKKKEKEKKTRQGLNPRTDKFLVSVLFTIKKEYEDGAGQDSVQQEFRRRFGRAPPTPVTIRNNFKKYRDEGTSQNLCKQRSGRPRTALCVSANLRTIKGSLTWCKLHTHHDVFQTDK